MKFSTARTQPEHFHSTCKGTGNSKRSFSAGKSRWSENSGLYARNENALSRQAEAGFTLVELLIVISIVVILMLVLIPQLTSARIAGNETAARADLKNITAAELAYSTSFPEKGFTCNFSDLTSGSSSFLDKSLAGGTQAGYTFTFSGCTSKGGAVNYYQIVAQPQVVGKTGRASFCTDINGSVTTDPTGGTNCLQAQPGTVAPPATGAAPAPGAASDATPAASAPPATTTSSQ